MQYMKSKAAHTSHVLCMRKKQNVAKLQQQLFPL